MIKQQKGFTLIEAMIVVVIIAILAAIAVPSYQKHIQKTRRGDAKESLTRIAAMQERFFFTHDRYGTLAELGLVTEGEVLFSQEDNYIIVLVGSTACGTGANTFPCYEATATARGAQVADTECKMFSINHVGRKTSMNSENDANPIGQCW